ncbi:MAG TPA: hypothetical protein V6C82_03195 [Chroococcales cyanobacterium]|jgi:hypothetical protein
MATVQTVVFENVEIDVSNNKQLFIHPIHRIVAEEFPIEVGFAVLSCAYDLPAGSFGCKHSVWTEDKKKLLIDYTHKPIALDKTGGGMGFRTTFENIPIDKPGRYWIRTELSNGLKGDEICLRVESQKGKPKLNLKA